MKRTFIGAALALALVTPAAAAHAPRQRHVAPAEGFKIGVSKLSDDIPGRLGAVLPTGSCNPGWPQGFIPSAAQWGIVLGCPLPLAGGSMNGALGLPASTSATAPLNIAPGATPTAPNNGDLWTTSSGVFAEIAGATIGPFGSGGGGGGSNTSFLASGNYVNVPTVTVSASQFLTGFLGPNAVLKNYGTTQIIFHAAPTSTSVTMTNFDGMVEPGGTQEIAIGTNAAIAVASVVNGAISGTGKVQIIDGSGLWTGSGGGGVGGSSALLSNYGTSPGAVPVPAVNAFVTNPITPTPFQSNGNYLNVASVTSASQNFTLPGGTNVVIYNYGGYKIIYQLSTSGASIVTTATADGVLQPGVTEIAVGSNTNIAVATTTSGLTSSLQAVGGTGLWTGSSNSNVFAGQTGLPVPAFAAEIGGIDNSNLMQPFGSTAGGVPSTKNFLGVQGSGAGGAVTVICPGGGTACFGGTVGANVSVVGVPLDASVAGSSAITAADAVSTSTTGAGGQTIWTLAPTPASVETFGLATYQGLLISARGTFTSTTTLVVEGTMDNAAAQTAGTAKWVAEPVVIPGQTTGLSSFNAPFEQAALVATGLQGARCRVTVFTTSDSITCTVRTTLSQPGNALQGMSPANPLQVAGNIVQANHSLPISLSAASTTQLVLGVIGKTIYVTHWDATVTGTTNLTFAYATGTNCAGGTTPLTGAYGLSLTALPGLSPGDGLGPILVVPAGDSLCAVNSAAVGVNGSFAYTQF